MSILGEIKAYVAGALLLLFGVLAAAARHFFKQRNKAREESERLRRRAEKVDQRFERWQKTLRGDMKTIIYEVDNEKMKYRRRESDNKESEGAHGRIKP